MTQSLELTGLGFKKAVAEEHYGATYIGCYDLPDREGPFDVFYQPNPNVEAGHTHYFGLWRNPLTDEIYITNAASILAARFAAIQINGRFLVSRYRHDYRTEGPAMIDGGLAYVRCNPNFPPTHTMRIEIDREVFEPIGGA